MSKGECAWSPLDFCRDRASAYAEAARRSAPTAQQVADRFHLLMNLTEVLKKMMERNRQCLRLPITDPALTVASSSTHCLAPEIPPPVVSVKGC